MNTEGRDMARPRLWTPSFCAVAAGNFLLFFSFYLLLPILPMYVGETFSADKSLTGMVLASYTIMALLVRPLS
ncbi:MAG: MFS transporter, partial [Bacteroidaceae bacterium]|nr:MFS transporter [Bacteroidaceae bacterium]